MTRTADLFGPVAEDIPAVADRLRGLSNGHHSLLSEALAYVFDSPGKQIRPALVLLSGRLGRFQRDRLVTLAASIEAVHTATLVHDDAIDEALSRRGLAALHRVWDRKVAILVGDYLFAQSAQLASELDNVPIMGLLSETVMAMSSGELRQYAAAFHGTPDEEEYLQRIAGKTASLFAMCCRGGAIVSEQSPERAEALRAYGLNLGMAFQIADDVLDIVGDDKTLGKPAGSDLRQGTVTLPVILYAQQAADHRRLLDRMEDAQDVQTIVRAVQASDAPTRALERARQFASSARGALEAFPPSEAREALVDLTDHVVTRGY